MQAVRKVVCLSSQFPALEQTKENLYQTKAARSRLLLLVTVIVSYVYCNANHCHKKTKTINQPTKQNNNKITDQSNKQNNNKRT
jgi:hypothetical protein